MTPCIVFMQSPVTGGGSGIESRQAALLAKLPSRIHTSRNASSRAQGTVVALVDTTSRYSSEGKETEIYRMELEM